VRAKITRDKKFTEMKTEADFADNKNAFYRRRCNMNVGGVKTNC